MAGKYAFSTEIQRSYMDGADASGIVDQTRLIEYCIRAHGAYVRKLRQDYNLSFDPDQLGVVVKTEANWLSPMRLAGLAEDEEPAIVSLRCARIGTSSFAYEYEIRQGDRPVAEIAETFVLLNRDSGRPQPISDQLKSAMLTFHERAGVPVGASAAR